MRSNLNTLKVLSPNTPKVNNPTEMQRAAIDAYWDVVIKHIDFVLDMQKTIPNWLPEFTPIY